MKEMAFASASHLAALIRQRKISCLELVDYFIARRAAKRKIERSDAQILGLLGRRRYRTRASTVHQLGSDHDRSTVGESSCSKCSREQSHGNLSTPDSEILKAEMSHVAGSNRSLASKTIGVSVR
jgi:hypothetical protein